MDKIKSKQIARELVMKYAKDELVLFDEMWSDYQIYGSIDDADTSERSHGLGGVAEINYLSAIIIPVVLAFGTRLATLSAEAIYSYIKEELLGNKKKEKLSFSEEQLKSLAVEISNRLKNP